MTRFFILTITDLQDFSRVVFEGAYAHHRNAQLKANEFDQLADVGEEYDYSITEHVLRDVE